MKDRMSNFGLSKLTEEMGECGQIVGKLLQFPELMMEQDKMHPDGTILRDRLEEEIADMLAAARFVSVKMGLNIQRIFQRQVQKELLFNKWDSGDGDVLS